MAHDNNHRMEEGEGERNRERTEEASFYESGSLLLSTPGEGFRSSLLGNVVVANVVILVGEKHNVGLGDMLSYATLRMPHYELNLTHSLNQSFP